MGAGGTWTHIPSLTRVPLRRRGSVVAVAAEERGTGTEGWEHGHDPSLGPCPDPLSLDPWGRGRPGFPTPLARNPGGEGHEGRDDAENTQRGEAQGV